MLTPMSRPASTRVRGPLGNLLLFPLLASDNARGVGLAAHRLAAWMWFMGLGWCVSCSSGCLVTDVIPFEEQPVEPPVILDSPTSARRIGFPFWMDKTTYTMWTMAVVVREKDATRPLTAHFRIVDPEVDVTRNPPPFDAIPVPAGGIDPELRDLTFQVQTDSLALNHCHRLELAVSGHFLDFSDPPFFSLVEKAFKDDLATAVWPVFEGTGDPATSPNAADLLNSCKATIALSSAGGATAPEVGR
jgi:hypothetical protein